jgi:hypothetical protein
MFFITLFYSSWMCLYFFSLSNIKINFSFLYTPKQIFSLLFFASIFVFVYFTYTHAAKCSYHPLFFCSLTTSLYIEEKTFFVKLLFYPFFLTCKNLCTFYVLLQATIFIVPLCYTVNNPMLNAFLFFCSSFNPCTILTVK